MSICPTICSSDSFLSVASTQRSRRRDRAAPARGARQHERQASATARRRIGVSRRHPRIWFAVHGSSSGIWVNRATVQPVTATYNRAVIAAATHKAAAPARVRCFVLTVSDTRTDDTDTGGGAIGELLKAAGHTSPARRIVKDEPAEVAELVLQQAASGDRRRHHHDRRHRPHQPRQHLRGDRRAARQAAARLRRAVPDAQLPGHRLGGDDEPRLRRTRCGKIVVSRCPGRRTPCGWR